MASEQGEKLKVIDLNPHLACILCGGYFIDATTITECLHSFCRACIVRYLETSKYCPVCEVLVHKTRPLRCIRSDRLLQDIVYKLVPGLYQNEMMRRRELYASQPPEALKDSRDEEDRGEGLENRYIYTSDEVFCLALKYRSNDVETSCNEDSEDVESAPKRRFLRCPASLRMIHLKKFIRLKYAIPKSFQVALQFENEILDDDYTLMDVAYISSWKRNGPLQLTFRVLNKPKVAYKQPLDSSTIPENQSNDASTVVSDADSERTISCPAANDESTESNAADDIVPREDSERSISSNNNDPDSEEFLPKSDAVTSSKPSKEVIESSKAVENENKEDDLVQPPEEDTESVARAKEPEPDSEDAGPPPPKVPKLTIPLTPKILQMAAQHAEDDKMELDSELFEGRLVIAEPEPSPKASEDDSLNNKDSMETPKSVDSDEAKKDIDVDDDEVDSGRGSDSSSRAEARSLYGDEELDSPGSSSVRTPELEKPSSFGLCSPSFSPAKNGDELKVDKSKLSDDLPKASSSCASSQPPVPATTVATAPTPKDDFGVLDLSMCHRKRGEDRLPLPRPKQVANPPVLDKYRQTTPCLPLPDHPSFKSIFPSVFSHPSMYKKQDFNRGNFRFNRSSILTVINPDPNSCRPKIVIKNLDPKPDHRHHHHHHHHHHHGHHHQKM